MGFPLFGVGLGCRLLLRFSFAEIRFAHFSSAETRFARFQAAFQTGFWAISGSGVSTKFKFKKQPALFILCGNRRGFGNLLSLLRGRVFGFAVILGAGCHRSESVIQPTDVRARVLLFRVGMAAIRHVPPLKLLPPVRVCPIPQEWGSCRLLLAFQAACTINSTAFCTWISVLSSRGTGVSPCCTSRPISVQPRMTACAPRSAKVAMAFR